MDAESKDIADFYIRHLQYNNVYTTWFNTKKFCI
jgi:hypothetical protein